VDEKTTRQLHHALCHASSILHEAWSIARENGEDVWYIYGYLADQVNEQAAILSCQLYPEEN
jgi:hypothetical protein